MENDISKIQESTFKPFKKVTKIILDTSVLNHLFSHNINIGAEILAILNLYKEDVWIPNTVYKEFLKIDEKKLIASKVKEYKDIGKCLKEEYNSFNQKVQNIFMKVDNNKLFEDWEEIKDKLNFKLNEILDTIEDKNESIDISNYKIKVESYFQETKKFVEYLYKNKKVGKGFTFTELIEICREGAVRYDCRLPPGYSDVTKKGIEKYNDLIIWKEILRYTQEYESIDVIFVTDDCKSGNWYEKESDNDKKKVINSYLYNEFNELNNDYSDYKWSNSIQIITLVEFFEYCKVDYTIETYVNIDEEKQTNKIIQMYMSTICNELYDYVCTIDYTEISEEFWRCSYADIGYEELEVCSSSVKVLDNEIVYKLEVQLPFNLVFDYEDNEGDNFMLGSAEILVSAIIEINQMYGKSSLNKYALLGAKNIENKNLEVCNIKYEIISIIDPYDYYGED
ncbi:MAG: hypothetical protein KIC47_03410 [Clostridium sp.]|uniref:PIN-like domain-containing protein n=1 Tax=Clostridium neonatale TaxID=137838 RepID=UPI001DC46A80|nr:PIN-like domain-containing protein [Clostridium neonatale]MBS5949357.1 hypothetical protein [Clostridium sp.]CAI3539587.1 putative PIN_8 domain-containing protein [Clostridium neonatale]CAI3606418.1 putative PIN_8 domain-containing protein [Clostridium neonatale]